MKLSDLIKELQDVMEQHGDIEAQLQDSDSDHESIIDSPSFFIVPEEYSNDEIRCNIRWWPY